MIKRNAALLRKGEPPTKEELQSIPKNPIYIILDDVLDTYNIGSVFRLADAISAQKVLLCAGSETPPNHRIKKASINTTEWVEWEYFETTAEAIRSLRLEVQDIQIVAVELGEKSVPYDEFPYTFPIALIVGHETTGVSPEIQNLCDGVVELPMYGVNISLNVMVSLGIALYEVIRHLPKNIQSHE